MRYLLILICLSGCTPYIGYTHLSDPKVANDGYDLACGGFKYYGELMVAGAICENMRGGEFVKIDVEYSWQ